MNDRSDASPVYHGAGTVGRLTARLLRRPQPGPVPRVFALVRDDDEVAGLVAWGMELPGGDAVTVGSTADAREGRNIGSWSSPHRAARIHQAEIEWV